MKKRILIGFLLVVLVALAGVWFYLETIVTKSVNKFGSEITGTEVKLGGFKLSPFAGEVSISDLTVANPENYKTPYLLSLGGVFVKIDMKSIFTDTIIIKDISITKPVITYEMISLTQNNIKQLQTNISKNTASAPQEKVSESKSEKTSTKSSKKIVIEKVTVAEGELKAVTSVPGDKGLIDVKLPEIVLTNIGGSSKKESTNIVLSITKILNKILATASQTVVKSGLNDLKNVAENNLNNVVGGVKDKIKSIGIFGK